MNSTLELALRGVDARADLARADLMGEARAIGELLLQSRAVILADAYVLSAPVLSEAQADELDTDPSLGNFALDLAEHAFASLGEPQAMPGAAFVAGFNAGALTAEGAPLSQDPFSFVERDAIGSPVSRAAQILFAHVQGQLGESFGSGGRHAAVNDDALWAICQRAQGVFLSRKPLALSMVLGFVQGILVQQNRVDALDLLDRSLSRLHAAAGFVAPRAPSRATSAATSASAPGSAQTQSIAAGDAEAEEIVSAARLEETAVAQTQAPVLLSDQPDLPVEALQSAQAAEADTAARAPLDGVTNVAQSVAAVVERATEAAMDALVAGAQIATPAGAPNQSELLEEATNGAGFPAATEEFHALPNGIVGGVAGAPVDAQAPVAQQKPKRPARPRGPTRPPKSQKPKARETAEPEEGAPAEALAAPSPARMALRLDELRRERKNRLRQKNLNEAGKNGAVKNETPPASAAPAESSSEASAPPSAPEPRPVASPSAAPKPKRLPARVAARARKSGPANGPSA